MKRLSAAHATDETTDPWLELQQQLGYSGADPDKLPPEDRPAVFSTSLKRPRPRYGDGVSKPKQLAAWKGAKISSVSVIPVVGSQSSRQSPSLESPESMSELVRCTQRMSSAIEAPQPRDDVDRFFIVAEGPFAGRAIAQVVARNTLATSHMLHASGARYHVRIFDFRDPNSLPRAARLMDRRGLHDCLILCVLPAQC